MTQLSNHQLLRAHRFVLEIHAAGTVDRLRQIVPQGLSRLISSERVSFNEMTLTNIVPTPLPSWWSRLGEVYRHHLWDHPLWRSTRMHRVVGFDDCAHRKMWRTSALYQHYFLPLGIKHQISSLVHRGGPNVGVAINRCSRDFSTTDRGLLELLSPHIGQAWHNALTLAAIRQPSPESSGTHGLVGTAVITLGPQADTVCDLSAEAARMVQTFFGRDSAGYARLPDNLSRWLRVQLERLSQTSEFSPATPDPLLIAAAGGSLTVRLVRRTADEVLLLLSQGSGGVSAPPARDVPTGKSDQPAPALTEREREIVHWLQEGKRNSEIGIILGISARTVGKHLEHLFTKLGVDNRTAAVRAASEAMAKWA